MGGQNNKSNTYCTQCGAQLSDIINSPPINLVAEEKHLNASTKQNETNDNTSVAANGPNQNDNRWWGQVDYNTKQKILFYLMVGGACIIAFFSNPEFTTTLSIIGVFLGVYFLPTISAAIKNKDNTPAIFILNLFLGWTLIGWVVALSWAATKE